jgi:hypothetical protein
MHEINSDSSCSAQLSSFKPRFPDFERPKGFDRALRLWWNQRDRYLTGQEILECAEKVPEAQVLNHHFSQLHNFLNIGF